MKIKQMFKKIEVFIEEIENQYNSFYLCLISFISILIMRFIMEGLIDGFSNRTLNYFFYHFFDISLFFTLSFVIFSIILKRMLGLELIKIANILLFGFIITIFPPLIDHLIFGDDFYLSFYSLYGLKEMPVRFFTFFGEGLNFGMTYGVRIEIALSIVFIFIYGYVKTKNWLKSSLLAFYSYITLFLLASLPSWIVILLWGPKEGFLNIGELDVVRIFLTPAKIFSRDVGDLSNALSVKMTLVFSLLITFFVILGLFLEYREKLFSFLKNMRPAQIIYHLGLLFVGIGLGYRFTTVTWDINFFNMLAIMNVSLAVILAWLASVVVNDIADKKIDEVSNKDRPLVSGKFSEKEYRTIGILLFLFSIIFAALASHKVAMLLIAYQAIAWMYSAQPFRLKRIPLLATFMSALASLIVMLSGFMLVSHSESIDGLPSQIIWLLVIAFTLSLPIKDLKDIEGDKEDGVNTIPVIFGEYWGKIIIGSGVFVSYILSVLFLKEFDLLFWAIILGGTSFWVVNFSGAGKKITHRNVFWWILGLVFVYGLMLIQYI